MRAPADFLAARVRGRGASVTVALTEGARALKAQGVDVIDLAGGDPDFPTPAHIRRAAETALEAGQTRYAPSAGVAALRAAIALKLERENGVHVEPAGVLVTPGGKSALYQAAQAFIEPGVDVLVIEPAWVSFAPIVELAGGRAVPVRLAPETGFKLTRELLEAAVTPATRLIIVNSPNNPTGRILDEAERAALVAVAQRFDLLVFSDEIYEKLAFDRPHVSVASAPGMGGRTLVFNGFSKAYAMTGWRVGYVAGPTELIAPIAKIHSHAITCVSPFTQAGALAALEGPQDEVSAMAAAYERRRRLLASGLSRGGRIRCPLPEGALYAFADVRALGAPSGQLAERLLREAHVQTVPGSAFGPAGEGYLRFALTAPDSRLEEAVERIATCLK